MSMGTSACYDDVISVKHVKKLCPDSYKNFLKALKDQKVDLEDFARQYQYDEVENDELVEAWNKLANDFEKVTSVPNNPKNKKGGLLLGIAAHNKEDDGDKYDEVDGVFFTVGGMYQLTPSGKKFNKFVERKFYTQWG